MNIYDCGWTVAWNNMFYLLSSKLHRGLKGFSLQENTFLRRGLQSSSNINKVWGWGSRWMLEIASGNWRKVNPNCLPWAKATGCTFAEHHLNLRNGGTRHVWRWMLMTLLYKRKIKLNKFPSHKHPGRCSTVEKRTLFSWEFEIERADLGTPGNKRI